MTDWAEEKAREIVDACTERRKMTLPSGREADVVVAIHTSADKIAAAFREIDKRAREECAGHCDKAELTMYSQMDRYQEGSEGHRLAGMAADVARLIAARIRSTIKEAQHD